MCFVHKYPTNQYSTFHCSQSYDELNLTLFNISSLCNKIHATKWQCIHNKALYTFTLMYEHQCPMHNIFNAIISTLKVVTNFVFLFSNIKPLNQLFQIGPERILPFLEFDFAVDGRLRPYIEDLSLFNNFTSSYPTLCKSHNIGKY